ncbi:MAG TPA: hypothetical protein VGM14_21330 [Streptosporangiaceae bacterium]|jgi:hypothetical protein
MIMKSLGLAATLGLGVAVAANWPDLQRYLKIRKMSAAAPHPEVVPAGGRISYPRQSGGGVPDGTGDFDSAKRGGPALS